MGEASRSRSPNLEAGSLFSPAAPAWCRPQPAYETTSLGSGCSPCVRILLELQVLTRRDARFSAFVLQVPLAEEIANRCVGGRQRLFVGQEDDAEVFRPRPLSEAGAVHDRHILLANQFGDEDVVSFRDVDARVRVESSTWGHAAHPRSFRAPRHCQIAPAAQLALHFDQVILRAFERRLDRVLLRMIGAQTRPQQLVYSFQIRLDNGSFAAGNAPSDAPSWRKIVFG